MMINDAIDPHKEALYGVSRYREIVLLNNKPLAFINQFKKPEKCGRFSLVHAALGCLDCVTAVTKLRARRFLMIRSLRSMSDEDYIFLHVCRCYVTREDISAKVADIDSWAAAEALKRAQKSEKVLKAYYNKKRGEQV